MDQLEGLQCPPLQTSCVVLCRIFSTVGDIISAQEGVEYFEGGIPSVLWRDTIKYYGGCSVLWRMLNTVLECSVLWEGGGYHMRTVEEHHTVLWRMFSTVERYHQYFGGYHRSIWGNIISVEVVPKVPVVSPTVLNIIHSNDDIPQKYR